MGLYGPFTATVGQVQRCDVDSEAQGVYIRNTSIYDLAVSFKPAQPVGGASFGGGDWFEVVPSGDRAGLRIPNGLYGGGPFPGYVWVLPIDNTGSLALTGTSSANKQFWIASYPDLAAMPGDYASAQFQNLASQPRVVTLDAPGGAVTGAFLGVSAVSLIQFSSGHDLLNTAIAPRNAWASTLAFYLDAFSITLANGGGATYVQASLQLLQYDGSGTVQIQNDVLEFILSLNGPAGTSEAGPPFVYPPRRIGYGFLPFNASTARIGLAINVVTFSGGAATLAANWSATVDWNSNGNIPPIGQGSGVIGGARF